MLLATALIHLITQPPSSARLEREEQERASLLAEADRSMEDTSPAGAAEARSAAADAAAAAAHAAATASAAAAAAGDSAAGSSGSAGGGGTGQRDISRELLPGAERRWLHASLTYVRISSRPSHSSVSKACCSAFDHPFEFAHL